jgi:hypothetical protein
MLAKPMKIIKKSGKQEKSIIKSIRQNPLSKQAKSTKHVNKISQASKQNQSNKINEASKPD